MVLARPSRDGEKKEAPVECSHKDNVKPENTIQSYVFFLDEQFFVSTCYRQATTDQMEWFYETFAWKLQEAKELGKQIADYSGAKTEKYALDRHFEVCRQLLDKGYFYEE